MDPRGTNVPSRSARLHDSASPSDDAATPIQSLLSYQLTKVANAMSGGATLRYRRQFDVSIGEWRALALLGETSPLTQNKLARLAALDKAQMSRIAARLTERGFTRRRHGAGHTTELRLTRMGRVLYRGLITAANERNEAFLHCLTEHEREVVDAALDKLGTLAREFERSERVSY